MENKPILLSLYVLALASNAFASENDDECYTSPDNCLSVPTTAHPYLAHIEEEREESGRISKLSPYDPACIDDTSVEDTSGTITLGFRILHFFGIV